MPLSEVAAALSDPPAVYIVEENLREYQVEVELLEETPTYLHISIGVDDGTLPASIRPLCASVIRNKS